MHTTPIPPIMTLREAATICRVHHSTLRRAIRAGRLQVTRPGGRDIRITADQLLTWFSTGAEEGK